MYVCVWAHTHTIHMFFDLAIVATKGQHIHTHTMYYIIEDFRNY
jgi:hypothetical protein